MKLLVFGDLHGSKKAFKKIEEKIKKQKPDLLIDLGDITIFGGNMDLLVHKLAKFGKETLILHGNHESLDEMKKACSLFKNINFMHKKNVKIGDYLFIGYGGGGFSLTDKVFEQWSKKYLKRKEKIVLFTHAPPYGTKVDMIMEEHCGNKSIRKFIEKAKPILAISGHLHENEGKYDFIGKTRLLNPGPYGKILYI